MTGLPARQTRQEHSFLEVSFQGQHSAMSPIINFNVFVREILFTLDKELF